MGRETAPTKVNTIAKINMDITDAKEVKTRIEKLKDQIRALRQEIADTEQRHVEAVCGLGENGHSVYLLKDVHRWFELTYAQYLTIPRSVMQAMPADWQDTMVGCLEELDNTIDWRPDDNRCYFVTLRELIEEWDEDEQRFVEVWKGDLDDKFANYRHPVKMPWKDGTTT